MKKGPIEEPPRPTIPARIVTVMRVPQPGEAVQCFRCGAGVQIPEKVPPPDKDNDQGVSCTNCDQIILVYSLQSDGTISKTFMQRRG